MTTRDATSQRVKKRNPKLRYCIHDRSERQQCAKCGEIIRGQRKADTKESK